MNSALQLILILAGSLLTTMVLWLIYRVIRAGQRLSRARAFAAEQVFDLRQAPATRDINWWLKESPSENEIVNTLADALQRSGAKVSRHDGDQLIAYFGSRTDAKLDSLWISKPMEMPIRVIAKSYDMQGEVMVRVRLDDDFGFQLLLGKRKRRFHERYQQAFDRILETLLAELSSLKPEANKMIFWR